MSMDFMWFESKHVHRCNQQAKKENKAEKRQWQITEELSEFCNYKGFLWNKSLLCPKAENVH